MDSGPRLDTEVQTEVEIPLVMRQRQEQFPQLSVLELRLVSELGYARRCLIAAIEAQILLPMAFDKGKLEPPTRELEVASMSARDRVRGSGLLDLLNFEQHDWIKTHCLELVFRF